MKLDDAKWHYENNFPDDLPEESSATHMGMFMTWIILHDFMGEEISEFAQDDIEAVKNKKMTGRDFLLQNQDGKLVDQDMNQEGSDFATAYYDVDDGAYLGDYNKVFKNYKSSYYVDDNWDNYDKLAPVIDKAYDMWIKLNWPKILTNDMIDNVQTKGLWAKVKAMFS